MNQALLRDMVDSGLIFQSGSGRHKRYMAAGSPRFDTDASAESDAHLLWVAVYTHPGSTRAALAEAMGCAGSAVQIARLDAAIDMLLDDGRIVMRGDDDDEEPRYESLGFDLQPDLPEGPFAAVYDHFRAVTSTLRARMAEGDIDLERCGGSTFRFEVWDGHPSAAAVEGLLADTRRRMVELIEQVDAIPPPDDLERRRTLFYFGQSAGARVGRPAGEGLRLPPRRDGSGHAPARPRWMRRRSGPWRASDDFGRRRTDLTPRPYADWLRNAFSTAT